MAKVMQQIKSIGIIHTPFTQAEGTPIQPIYAKGAEGVIEIFPEYAQGLEDVDGFERIWLIYFFDRASAAKLKVVPFRDKSERGLFATRAPCRPNPIGLSAVRLLGIDGLHIRVADIDILDGTPLLDIKPYIPQVDSFPDSRAGWFDRSPNIQGCADDRFE
jgi:tRNA-Thr(GGU) m(6)t(6)A37 methyltransferase TsaA